MAGDQIVGTFRDRVSGDPNGSMVAGLNNNTTARLKQDAENAQAQADLSEAAATLSRAIMVNGFAHKAGQSIQNNTKQVVNGWLS
jgi:hypothetical protein